MSADTAAVIIVIVAVPAITAYGLLFGFGGPWWKTAVGRAHFVMTWGLLLLIDLSVGYHFFGDNYAARDAVRLTVYSLITAGCWLALGAWVYERRKAKRRRTPNRRADD